MPLYIERSNQPEIIPERVPTAIEAADPAFWLGVNPHLKITPEGSRFPLQPLDVKLDTASLNWLRHDGYMSFEHLFDAEFVGKLRLAVENLYFSGINPCFTFIYDEFWQVSRQLTRILSQVLGEHYYQLPDFWTWFLDPNRHDAGWRPHRDRVASNPLLPDGMPKSVTTWLALSDATPLNGCIYLLPAYLDEQYLNFESNSTDVNAHGIRALPADAGTLLLWNQRVVHWGGTSSRRALEPRISLAVEFQRADTPPFNSPLITSPNELMPYDLRLMLIAKQIVQYKHMYKVSDSLAELANSILE